MRPIGRRVAAALAPLALCMGVRSTALAETPAPSLWAASMIGVALNVVNIDKELAFYTEALGMQLKAKIPLGSKHEYILGFSPDSASPALLLMHETAASAPTQVQHGNGFSRVVMRVADVNAVAARLTALGYSHDGVREVTGGYHITMVTDPEGYRLELVQAPARK